MKSLKEIDTPEFLSSEIFLDYWIKSIYFVYHQKELKVRKQTRQSRETSD